MIALRQLPRLMVLLAAAPLAGQEAPPRFNVVLEFEGNQGVSTRSLRDALSGMLMELRRNGVNEGTLDDAVYELERFYRSQGFPRVKVIAGWSVDGDRQRVKFEVDEGLRSRLHDFVIEGAKHIPADSLKDCFSWIKTGFPGFTSDIYTEEVLADGKVCVVQRYQIDGYFYARVTDQVIEDRPGRFRVFLAVLEGPRIALDKPPRFEGNLTFSSSDLLKALDLRLPTWFVPRLPLVLKGKIVDFYRNHGYRWVDVDVDRRIDDEKNEALLVFRIKEGPLTRIEDLEITGLQKTRPWVVRKRIKLRPGDLYNEEKVRESFRSLFAAGIFSSVSIETLPVAGEDDRLHLKVKVSEKPKYKFSVLAGYGSWEMFRGKVSLEDTNIFGIGHRLKLEGFGSLRSEGGSIEYTNPFFFRDDLTHTARGYYEGREHPSFNSVEYGGETGVTYQLTRNIRTGLGYRLRESDANQIASEVPPELVQNVLISSIASSTSADFRNSAVDPERGSTHRLLVEYAGGGLGSEIDFVRLSGFSSVVLNLGRGLHLVTMARAGIIQPLAETDSIPIQERFFNGGESSIRSFLQDQASPKSNGEPIGGETFTTMNLELRFPLLILKELQGAAFADTGTCNEEVKEFAGGRYFWGVGGGIRYLTPVGPFRFDMAWNPDRHEGEDSFAFHIALGYPF